MKKREILIEEIILAKHLAAKVGQELHLEEGCLVSEDLDYIENGMGSIYFLGKLRRAEIVASCGFLDLDNVPIIVDLFCLEDSNIVSEMSVTKVDGQPIMQFLRSPSDIVDDIDCLT